MKVLVLLVLSIASSAVWANNDALMVDQKVDTSVVRAFPNERNIQPRKGDFKVLNFVPMSSETGDRWAIVTIQNTASGGRIFESSYLHGLFADGERRPPEDLKRTFAAGETVSVSLWFGKNKFPLLSVYTRDD